MGRTGQGRAGQDTRHVTGQGTRQAIGQGIEQNRTRIRESDRTGNHKTDQGIASEEYRWDVKVRE